MVRKKGFILDYSKIESQLWTIAEPIVASCGAELVDTEYVKEGGSWYVRIYIDREPPVDHNLCEQVSELVSDALDNSDPIPGSYYLEISSPGLERPLKRADEFRRYSGRDVLVKLYAPYEGRKEFTGVLQGLEEDNLWVNIDGEKVLFPLEQVAHVRLIAEF